MENSFGTPDVRGTYGRTHAMVLCAAINDHVVRRIEIARSLNATTVEILHVAADRQDSRSIHEEWRSLSLPVALTILGPVGRNVAQAIIDYVGEIASPDDLVIAMVPEVRGWWKGLFTGYFVRRLTRRLLTNPNVVITTTPTTALGGADDR